MQNANGGSLPSIASALVRRNVEIFTLQRFCNAPPPPSVRDV